VFGEELCTATVTGGASAPTGQVLFASPTAGFPRGNSCTLGASGSCQVSPAAIFAEAPRSIAVSANYSGDATHAPSTGATSFSTSAELAAIQNEAKNACGQFILPAVPGNSLTGTFSLSVPSSVTSQFVVGPVPGAAALNAAASRVRRGHAGAASASDAVTSSCDGSVGTTLPAVGASARTGSTAAVVPTCKTVKVRGRRRTRCSGPILVAGQTQTFTAPGRYTVQIPLTSEGKRVFKAIALLDKRFAAQQASLDKAYFRTHHRKRRHTAKPPRLTMGITITLKPLP
jgi:hypothetical protein